MATTLPTGTGTRVTAPAVSTSASSTARFVLRRIGRTVLTIAISAVILGILWNLAIVVLQANAFIAKTPADVFRWFFVDSELSRTTAAENRVHIAGLLGVTLWHAAIGFVFGVGGSLVVAVVFTLIRPVEFMFMPIAMLLRTVPLLAMAPVIYLVLGNGIVTAGFIGGVVVFFPLLVNLTLGFRSVSAQSVDLIRVYGGSRWTIMRKVAFPTALPYFFASMRIAVPGAITGAMLYEWLFTYEGLGAAITAAKSQSQYGEIWAIVVLITLVSIVLYTVTTFVETAVLAKWGPNAGKATAS
ncbi:MULTISPECIES: ABC transporter permease [unclassified Frigoribacterium]|jgi:ABC-type nitrate/sulfonate/bicarbonate transport system permease component|uniref:ABC transporter permease n=1 Tax=unclassified Frigoribacterium TaxID=2627005 RepID=UPI0015638924|nr:MULTISPECIES: ABC transporter permease subunit [unclassified Frigoribacterium]MBD8141759.1 ABC transporter permease subunit [Frigoribacterium sp. CFBP 13605]NQW88549.1 ABC transporter permease subunit [Frigoribacterium sp. VKM Ac-2860]NQX08642.1 ABC transporter permease subunit [Frigoribacterium sp. VKM Ac-2859]